MVHSVIPAGRRSARGRGGSRWVRPIQAVFLGIPTCLVVGWFAIHQVPGLGPWTADALRGLVGVEPVARLEDLAYAVEDRFNRFWRGHERPRARWHVPEWPKTGGSGASHEPARSAHRLGGSSTAFSSGPKTYAFQPTDVGPVHVSWKAPGDGAWVPLFPDRPSGDPPRPARRMYKTLLHPDPSRSWAELFVVAIDLRRVGLHLVPGTEEPSANLVEALEIERPGRIPDAHRETALAAFNGGFKTVHGGYGMHAGGVTIVAPHPQACTAVYYPDHRLRIGSWSSLGSTIDRALWWRQTPKCMFEDGHMHPRLAGGQARDWGATLDGQTVIRRSAMGIDARGDTLYVGIGNHTTAPAIALGMRHAGAVNVAQLDVNFSYPKFVSFRPEGGTGSRRAVPLSRGFECSDDEYLRKPSPRDFFYVTPKVTRRTARK